MAKFLSTLTATIPNGGTTSDSQTMPTTQYCLGIQTPAAYTGTSISFQSSPDGVTFTPLYKEATQYSVVIGPSRSVSLDPTVMQSAKYLKIVSNATEAAARSVVLIIGE